MSRLDQAIKGAPPPDAHPPSHVTKTPSPHLPQPSDEEQTPSPAPDPLSILPSSPPQIYLNLLVLEGSLRSQYLALRDRRRQNTFFLLILALWIAYFSYALFLRPREDGSGVGGSVYWVVEMAEKLALMGGVVTGILVWGTGQWERGVRWPRRWLGITNRGLRAINAKIVVIRGPWWRELLSYFSFLFPYSSFFPSTSSFHYVERPSSSRDKSKRLGAGRSAYGEDSDDGIEEDLAPGGDYIRLLLLPKAFSPAFRENWDEYRTEYWERENERRSQLRRKVEQRERQISKAEGGWLRWTGWLGWKSRKPASTALTGRDVEKSHHHHDPHHYRHHHHARQAGSRHGVEKETSRPRGTSGGTPSTTDPPSRSSSRSTTPNPVSDGEEKSSTANRQRPRRGSGASTSGNERKKKRSSISGQPGSGRAPSPLTKIERNTEGTPESDGSK